MSGTTELPDRGNRLDRYGWVVVVIVGLIAYSNSFQGRLYLDDHRIFENIESQLEQPNSLVPHPLTNRWLGNWSFALGVAAIGKTLPALHAVNVVIHLLAGVVLWAIVALTLRLPRFQDRFVDRAGFLATAVAGLWVVHPLTTQAVTYLSQRYESQMSLFVLVSVWSAIRGAVVTSGKIWWYLLAIGASYAATSTKEPAVVLPFVLLAYDRLFLAGSWWEAAHRRWPLYLGMLVTVVAILPIAMMAVTPPPPKVTEPLILSDAESLHRNIPKYVSAGFSATGLTPWMYLRSQPGVILHYLRLAILPAPLILDYGWPVASQWWQIWLPGLVVLVLLVATGLSLGRGVAGSFLGIWFFAFLGVTSSFIPIVDLAFEHRMYLPLAAVVTAAVLSADFGLAWAVERTGWRFGALRVGIVVVGITLMVLTISRNEDYRDPIRMYQKMLLVVPGNHRVWNNLGVEYMRRGRTAEAAQAFREAIAHPSELTPNITQLAWLNLIMALESSRQEELVPVLTEFVALEPDNPSRRFLLAHARFRDRDAGGAVEEYRKAIELASQSGFPLLEPMVFGYYGQALLDSGNPESAIAMYRRALELENSLPVLHVQLGQAFTRLGRYAEAEPQFRTASEQEPKVPVGPYNLGVLQMYLGKPAEAVTWFQEAIRRDRKYVLAVLGLASALQDSGRTVEAQQVFAGAHQMSRDWVQKTVDLSWRMSTHANPRARYAAESLRLARLTVAGVGDKDPGLLDVLAASLAENSQFEEAERTAGRAVKIANSGGHTSLAKEIEARRELYARRQPYRQPITSPR